MRTFEPIAIVGMSGRFPLADSLDSLDEVYSNQVDAVRPMSSKRKQLFGLPEDYVDAPRAYLDGVEYFDYDFFNISKHEAMSMDPQSRIAIELACEAIEDAGYSLEEVRGSKTSVYLGAHSSHYADWLQDNSGVAVMGNLKDTMAGRISYLLDLRGDAVVMETACSSSLYALYHGCIQLNAGETDMVIAGGITLDFQLHEAEKESGELVASDNHCKAFDQRADGINGGEGGGMVVLKRLNEAIEQKDSILAVIRSVAANQDGGRSNSMAAPSNQAQTEVLLEAWEKGKIHPQDIGYYEAHGTGTKLGDPIEISGITEAYRNYTAKTQICPIGSLKTNYAHLGASAGIASVVKMVLSMRKNKRYPLRDFQSANPFIDFEHSPVYPAETISPWPADKKKIAAISAFGISGTNVHLVLEEAPEQIKYPQKSNIPYLVTVSAANQESMEQYCMAIADALTTTNESLCDISYTLNKGRADYSYRKAVLASGCEELEKKLRTSSYVVECQKRRLVVLCSKIDSEADLVWGKQFYDTLKAHGVHPWKVIGAGTGNALMSYLTKSIQLDQAVEMLQQQTMEFKQQAFCDYITKLNEQESILCLEIGKEEILLKCLSEHTNITSNCKRYLSCATDSIEEVLGPVLVWHYESGGEIDWQEYYTQVSGRACHLPTYPFLKTEVWPAFLYKKNHCPKVVKQISDNAEEDLDLKEYLRTIWCRELEIDQMEDDDDFFDLGANSLMGMNILKAIEDKTKVSIDFESIYEYCTLSKLTEYLESMSDTAKEILQEENQKIHIVDRQEWMPVSYNQRRMLFLLESIQDVSVYNMPNLFYITEQADIDAICKSIEKIVERHEILHTIYEKRDGEYYQKVLENYTIPYEYEEKDTEDFLAVEKEFMKDCCYKFQLHQEIPIFHKIVKVKNNRTYWFVNVHHIAADGWSVGIFMQEFLTYYQGFHNNKVSDLKKSEIQYVDYSKWENDFLQSEKAEKEREFWQKELEGFRGILKFPVDKKRPPLQTYQGQTKRYEISLDIIEKLKNYSRANGLSLFMVLESAYALTLNWYTGDMDIGVGVPVANRTQEEIQNLIGFFSNTVVIRNRMQSEMTIEEFLKANAKVISTVYQNTQLPFEEVVSHTKFERCTEFSPLFQYSFVMQNYGKSETNFDTAGIKQVESVLPTASKFEMTLNAAEFNKGLEILVEYNTDLFFETTIDGFMMQYQEILQQITEEPTLQICQLHERKEEVSLEQQMETADAYSFY